MINISDIKIRLVKSSETRLRAVASIVINDCVALHDIKVLSGEKGLFVSMPSRKDSSGTYRDIVHPINNEARTIIWDSILQAYQVALEQAN